MYLGKLCDVIINWFIFFKIGKSHLNLSISHKGFSMFRVDINSPIKRCSSNTPFHYGFALNEVYKKLEK